MYPTPVAYLAPLSTAESTLWVKRDDLTNPVYGGSKVRKLEPLLSDAKQRGAVRVVTVGTVGSHHVLATGVFGRLAGLEVEAVVLPRPHSPHVIETARASVGQGVTLVPASSYTEALRHLSARTDEGCYPIPAGGSNRLSSTALVAAVYELAAQVRAGVLPEPELIVLPLGSGGTVAGLAAGLVRTGLRSRVLAVAVAEPVKVFAHKARALARELVDHSLRAGVLARIEIERRYLGEGYGQPTRASEHATRVAADVGLTLDATYTAKAFAAALDRIALGNEARVLFWHTFSGAPLAPLLQSAPTEAELDPDVRRLAQ